MMMFSGENNFRFELATLRPYKGNRDPASKPVLLPDIKEYFQRKFTWTSVDRLEADDLLAIWYLDKDPLGHGDAIIVTQDKDLLQVPGWHWNVGTKEHLKHGPANEKFYVSELDGHVHFYRQLISGDTTDNIPGLFQLTGVKNKKAHEETLNKMFSDDEMYEFVYGLYSEALGNKESTSEYYMTDLDCILWEIGNLLYMKRFEDEDECWNPPR
jgi:hypothetical protein